jgi:hypothetical protein
VKDFTEPAERPIQFADHLQQAPAASGAGQHQSVTCGLYLACNALAEETAVFMTNSPRQTKRADRICFSSPFSPNGAGTPSSRPVRHGMVMGQDSKTVFRTGNSP